MKNLLNNKYFLVIASVIMGLVIGGVLFSPSNENEDHDHSEVATNTEYTCSMHPQIRQKEPGNCPICGMALIPVDDSSEGSVDAITMSPEAVKLANIVTMKVGGGTAETNLNIVGKVKQDERRVYSQTSHIPGRIETLNINFTGEYVKAGQAIGTLYSPELVTAQKELLETYKIKESQPALFESAKQKLKNWKLTDGQIEKLVSSGVIQNAFPIKADKSGYVFERKVNQGDHVKMGQELFMTSDLSSVWVLFEVYEQDLSKVNIGQNLKFSVTAAPSQTFEGKITFISPLIDPKTRTASVRVEAKNTNGMLKPEMLASARLQLVGSNSESIQISKSAVLWTGERSVVYEKVEDNNGLSFVMREVTLGQQIGDYYVVTEGLEAGQEIAVNGTFSIDAAAQLAGKPSMMSPKVVIKEVANVNKIPTSETSKIEVEQVEIDQKAKTDLKPLYEQYFAFEKALVNDDYEGAKAAGGTFKDELSKISMTVFKGKAHELWMSFSNNMKASMEHIQHFSTIAEQRAAFMEISKNMIAMTKSFHPQEGTLYVQYCPMADDNKGANWLSQQEDILNPYFGDSMLTCGNVEEELK
ncbi:efflux RND transporter periplasmic adaptor subunit [Fulvivirga lutimaris]|uniref:efflux RND transporter periplasmic adaptor subunit n=1 Tax=Fulvivirga lutimaris TaxID=1819566 RepID=UPI0012BD2619|nr:efflux RND transporter periplasmic adaptor subunit [Fulvivirga lutimaris]MTI41427.1 efflux RND transporter periplasmic adaptor subunit [Fulvivirga lutimaris]